MAFWTKYYRFGKAAGLGVVIGSGGDMVFNLAMVELSGDSMDITTKLAGMTDVEKVASRIPPKVPIALNISGKGILYKKVGRIDTMDQEAFARILPNAVLTDFYVQNFVSGDFSHVALMRRTDADRLLGRLKGLGLQALMLSLGPFPIERVLGQLNIYESEYVIDGHKISRNEKGEWISYQYKEGEQSPFPIKLASEPVDEKIVIPYAMAFQLALAAEIDRIGADADNLSPLLERRLSANRVKVQGLIVLSVFFLLLLVNTVWFSSLNASNNKLNEQVSIDTQNSTDIQKISTLSKNKESRLRSLGWDEGVNKAIMIDRVLALMPAELTLSAVNVNPEDLARTRLMKTETFEDRVLKINGVAAEILPVNEWIARLKTVSWVKNISLVNYTFDNDKSIGSFAIKIKY
ncbi:MAG: hypothetical protein ACTHJ8_15420 [Mucilaginibacter sp.]